MAQAKTDYTEDWRLYEEGRDYKQRIDLFNTVDQNNRMYNDRQWDGVVSNGLPTPQFNVIKRVGNYKISSLMANSIKILYSVERGTPEQQAEVEKLNQYVETLWEKLKMEASCENVLKDGFIQGDGGTYYYWDDTYDTKEKYGEETIQGNICKEEIDNVCVFPGDCNNPVINTADKPVQPYMLIVFRRTVKDIREEAKRNKVSEADILNITPDEQNEYTAGDRGKIELDQSNKEETGKANVILKMWYDPKTKTIMARKSTRNVVIKEDWDTELKLYPIAMMNWEPIKNSFHGMSEVTAMIPNQRYINKSAAMIMLATMYVSYPKLMYDRTMIAQPSTQIGVAIPVNGNTAGAAQYLNPGQISPDVFKWFETVIQYTKDMMGANETALGDTSVTKTASGIIALQEAAAVPLESIQRRFYQYVEDVALILWDILSSKYKLPRTITYTEKGEEINESLDMRILKDARPKAKIDVGPSSRWSEAASMETLDNLLDKQLISDIEYFERIPDGFIKDKQGLLDSRKAMQEQEALMAEQQAQQPEAQPAVEQQQISVEEVMASLLPEEQAAIANDPAKQAQIADMIMQGGM
jgi:hypothetical protein